MPTARPSASRRRGWSRLAR